MKTLHKHEKSGVDLNCLQICVSRMGQDVWFYNACVLVGAVTDVTGPGDPSHFKRPSRPEPVLRPLPRVVFFHSFYPAPYYVGSLEE